MPKDKAANVIEPETIDTFYPTSAKHWRQWLERNHLKKAAVWLECYKKSASIPTVVWSDAVDEALCFGWIDSKRKSVGNDRFIQYFCKRKPGSGWSKINKEKVERLISEGRMTSAGLRCIEEAKKSGSWTALDRVEELKIPTELMTVFKADRKVKSYYTGLSKSVMKMILAWISLAKRSETRLKRAREFADQARKNTLPKQFQ